MYSNPRSSSILPFCGLSYYRLFDDVKLEVLIAKYDVVVRTAVSMTKSLMTDWLFLSYNV